jgi:hypothetical protein
VLVVLIAIFTGRIAIFSSDLDKVASLEGTKVRAQLIGQNCVPSDAGVTSLITSVDTLPKNNRLDDTERLAFSTQLEILKGRCTGKNNEGAGACRVEIGCQWQGS